MVHAVPFILRALGGGLGGGVVCWCYVLCILCVVCNVFRLLCSFTLVSFMSFFSFASRPTALNVQTETGLVFSFSDGPEKLNAPPLEICRLKRMLKRAPEN